MDILATFQDNGAQAKLNEAKGSKQSARTSTDDDDLRSLADIRIVGMLIGIVSRLFVDEYAHLQIDEDSTLAGIDATPQDTHSSDGAYVKAILVSQPRAQRLFIGSHLWLYSHLILIGHSSLLTLKEVLDFVNLVVIEPF